MARLDIRSAVWQGTTKTATEEFELTVRCMMSWTADPKVERILEKWHLTVIVSIWDHEHHGLEEMRLRKGDGGRIEDSRLRESSIENSRL